MIWNSSCCYKNTSHLWTTRIWSIEYIFFFLFAICLDRFHWSQSTWLLEMILCILVLYVTSKGRWIIQVNYLLYQSLIFFCLQFSRLPLWKIISNSNVLYHSNYDFTLPLKFLLSTVSTLRKLAVTFFLDTNNMTSIFWNYILWN